MKNDAANLLLPRQHLLLSCTQKDISDNPGGWVHVSSIDCSR